MTEIRDEKVATGYGELPAVAEEDADAVRVGLDDGYAYTKVALPDGRLVAIPSRGRIGRAGVTWIRDDQQRIHEYETDGSIYAVGAVDGDPTDFEGYPSSGLNRAIVQHALRHAGLAGASVHGVSGLPVSAFYQQDGQRRERVIRKKRDSLKRPVEPLVPGQGREGARKVSIGFHEVIPEALAAWYDLVIRADGSGVSLDEDRLRAPIAVVDIGGRTTDFVVVQDEGIVHGSSGSLHCGMLDVKARVLGTLQTLFGIESLSEQRLSQAVETHRLRLHGTDHDLGWLVNEAKREVVERIFAETRRHLGLGAELDQVLFVGGGSAALAADLTDWFPHQTIADHAAFANARGMLKYLQFVCDETG